MKKKLLVALCAALAALVVAAGLLGWQAHRLAVFARTPHAVQREVVVTVRPKTGPKAVSEKLFQAGAITSARLFYWEVRFRRRLAGRLKAGQYLFRKGEAQTPSQIIARLLRGEVLDVKVTIPEGLRLDEEAAIFAAHGVGDPATFIRLARDPAFARSAGIDAKSLEGYLFPDTYLVPKNIQTAALLKLMVLHFQAAYAAADERRQAGIALDERQTATLASIIEKETGQAQERPHISCVFHNRLKLGMKLQTDPTVIYSIILKEGHFDGDIHKRDLSIDSPYNTYEHTGLPPGPIANAGLASLIAALDPSKCDDLYFVSKNDGTHVFCPTLACHERAVEKWQVEYFRKKWAAERGTRSRGR